MSIPAEDLQRCHDVLGQSTWETIAGHRVFITGGTGFIGKWLLATLLDANEAFSLNCQITALSRDPAAFLRSWPETARHIEWIAGDVRDFACHDGHFDTIIHAATDVVARVSPQTAFATCLEGTRRVLDLAQASGARQLLLLSSGAIYGPLPAGITHVPETHLGGPDPLLEDSAYGEGKRVSEWMAAQAASATLTVKIARVFALVGPHLPLDKQFAIGNFLGAAMAGDAIVIQGDGTPHRSYMYASDMAAWLWAILFRGRSKEAYNVGSEENLSIASLAQRVCQVLGSTSQMDVRKKPRAGFAPAYYVPDCRKAREQLGLPVPMALDEAIIRTAAWHALARRPSP